MDKAYFCSMLKDNIYRKNITVQDFTFSRKEITESVLAGIISRLNLKTINIRSSKNM